MFTNWFLPTANILDRPSTCILVGKLAVTFVSVGRLLSAWNYILLPQFCQLYYALRLAHRFHNPIGAFRRKAGYKYGILSGPYKF